MPKQAESQDFILPSSIQRQIGAHKPAWKIAQCLSCGLTGSTVILKHQQEEHMRD